MTNIAADNLYFNAHVTDINRFMSDLQNFKDIMPEQVEDWNAKKEACAFSIKNLGKLGMKISKPDQQGSFKFESSEQSKVDFSLLFHYKLTGDQVNSGYFEIITEMNPLVEMMAKRPLTNFVNLLTKNLKQKMS